MSIDALNMEFEVWWNEEGSRAPEKGDDMYEHCKKQCELAWRAAVAKPATVPAEILNRDAQRRELPAYLRSVPGIIVPSGPGVDIDAVHMRGAQAK